MHATNLSTADILIAGCATFTLEGKGRRWTYRIERVESENNRPIFFAKVLMGSDNESDYTYIGVYDSVNGWVRLTRASKFAETAEVVRALRWVVAGVFNLREHEIEANGFTLHWSATCQRCGRILTVPSSIDARLGPECAKHVGN